MKTIYPFLFLILLLTFSCSQAKKTDVSEQTIDSLGLNSNLISTKLGELLIPTASNELANWKEYQNLDEFIESYYNISIYDALNSATELESLVKLMKDSIRVENLKNDSFKARLNVLHNETLRLVDMATISSISNDEVASEVNQILELYSSINSKINTVYKAKSIQDSLEVDTETPIELTDEVLKQIVNKNNDTIGKVK
jgi:hypothetical protein